MGQLDQRIALVTGRLRSWEGDRAPLVIGQIHEFFEGYTQSTG
jgi:hypothetical protein